MASRKFPTKYPGVRYRQHETRKLRTGGFDRYYTIRYSSGYKDREEGLGWASEGWTPEKAHAVLARLKQAMRLGQATSLADLRAESLAERETSEDAARREAVQTMTLGHFLTEHFLPDVRSRKRSWRHDECRINAQILPRLGSLPLRAVTTHDLREFLRHLREASFSEATCLQYLAILRSAFNLARSTVLDGVPVFTGESPLVGLRLPQPKNARYRYLKYAEADLLVAGAEDLGLCDLRDAIVLALNTGFRRNEILRLEWADVDFDSGTLCVRDDDARKPGGRMAINADLRKVLLARKAAWDRQPLPRRDRDSRVFAPPEGGQDAAAMMRGFEVLIDQLGLNDGITDARNKLVFHTLRHTFASWLALQGTDIYRIQKLMRHKTITMTMRYAHLIPEATFAAVHNLRPKGS